MKSETEILLHREVASRLRAAIPRMVPIVGADDVEELLQDGLVIAIHLHRSARKAGKQVGAGNVARYALLHLRSGRRSTGYKKNDVHHPAAQLNGRVRLQSMDEPIRGDENGEEPLTLHECLAGDAEDPSMSAARRLDWEAVLDALDRTAKAVLVALVEGTELTLLVRPLRRSRSALQGVKAKLGRLILERLGDDVLIEAQARPAWTTTVDAVRQRLACRAERRVD